MGRRGFFAELQRQVRVAEREQAHRQREAVRNHGARLRHREHTLKAAERARTQLAKATAAEYKRLEKQAREAHIAANEAEVEERNQDLQNIYADIDTLLAYTLSRDDYVDLETLRVQVQHPPFDPKNLDTPIPIPVQAAMPMQPTLRMPEAPRGLSKIFGKKKHAAAVADAERAHKNGILEWKAKCEAFESQRQDAVEQHAQAEQSRLQKLDRAKSRYADECQARADDAAARNGQLDELISNLGYGTVEAVQEYVSIVLSNSVYPDHFPVTFEFKFDPDNAELELHMEMPAPDDLPTEKAYKYAKASDEIVSTTLSQKECRERYASAVCQIALRSFHEVFESDRRGLVRTVSLEVGAVAVDPGT
ncbi:MAG: hypothetical protein ABI852_21050, partial [Gemmatimonadaceae bacterium]